MARRNSALAVERYLARVDLPYPLLPVAMYPIVGDFDRLINYTSYAENTVSI